MTDAMRNVNLGSMSPDKTLGFLGLAVAAFGLLKFLLVITNQPGWAAFVGLVLLIALAMSLQFCVMRKSRFDFLTARATRSTAAWTCWSASCAARSNPRMPTAP